MTDCTPGDNSARLTEPWHIRIAMIVSLFILISVASRADERLPVRSLRESARNILADPEFRHFEHFADDSFRKANPDSTAAEGSDSPPVEGNASNSSSTKNGTAPSPSEAEPWWKNALNRAQPKSSGNGTGNGTGNGSSRNQRLSPSGSSPSTGNNSTSSESDSQNGNASTSNGSPSSNNQESAGQTSDSSRGSTGKSRVSSNSSGSSPSANSDPASSSPPQASGDQSTSSSAQPSTETSNSNGGRGKPTRPSSKSASSTPSAERPSRMQGHGSPSQRGSDGVQRPVRQSSRSAPAQRPASPSSEGPGWQGPSLGLGNLLGGLFHGIAYLILAIIVVAIVVLVIQALMHAWNDRQRTPQGWGDVTIGPLAHDRSPGETESDVFVREALAFAQSGNFRAAIGRLVLGGMSFIERQQWIRYRRGLTVHDYLRVLRSRPEQFAGFRDVVHVFEPVEYGRRPATEPLFATALAAYRQGFQINQEEPSPAT